jgi:hypothetical protein
MEFNNIASTGRDNPHHTRPTTPPEGSYAQVDLEGSGGSDGRAQATREQYSDGGSAPGALVEHHTTTLVHAH